MTISNARAVTLYLWHEIALILAVPLIDQFWNIPAFEKYLPLESQWFMFGIGWILIAVFILLCGWGGGGRGGPEETEAAAVGRRVRW